MARKSRRRSSTTTSRRAVAVREQAALRQALLGLPAMSPEQGATVADVHPSTIRRACEPGAPHPLRHVRINGGKLIRFTPAWLLEWLGAQPTAT
jgi:hypothetical protein